MRRSRPLAVVAWVLAVASALVAVGTLADGLPWLGYAATSASGMAAPQLALVALVALGLAALSRRRGRPVRVLLALFAVVVAGQTVVLQVRAADRAGASIDWSAALLLRGSDSAPPATETFATVAGRPLRVDVHAPAPGRARGIPVIQVHGGGFTAGTRDADAADAAALAAVGYTVLAVDYRLGPTPTWDKAAPDVACAAAWVAREADRLAVDPAKLVLAGGSAGGALALEVAYGRDTPSCTGPVPRAAAVVAYYPAVDRAARWRDAGALREGVRRYTEDYLGGTPADQPARYRDTDPVTLAGPGVPPTLLITGARDHITGTEPQRVLAARLAAADVPHELVVLPRTDHAFNTFAPSGIPAQAARAAVRRFLARSVG